MVVAMRGLVGVTAWLLVLAPVSGVTVTVSALPREEHQAYLESFQENRLDERGLDFFLRTSCRDNEYVALSVGLIPLEDRNGIPIRVSEYDFQDFFVRHRSRRNWTCTVASKERWLSAVEFLCEKAEFLDEGTAWRCQTPRGPVYIAVALLYHFPQQRFLEIGRLTCVLSKEAQRYLSVSEISDYSASRNILIVQEPHYELDRQFALFKGLEVLFRDNPRLLMENRAAFLAEGYPSGEGLSVQPLVGAEPRPSEALILEVLSTFTIPGYVAYEWKYQQGIPIIGVEDSRLYSIGARIWSEIQGGLNGGRPLLWPHTVAARNHQIALTLSALLGEHETPILFVGGRHLEPLTANEQLRKGDWLRFGSLLDDEDLAYLRESDERSLPEHLRERRIGFCFLSAKGDPFPDPGIQRLAIDQYASLMRTQQSDIRSPHLRYFGNRGDSVTVAPSTEAAAAAVLAAKGGSKSEGGKKGKKGQGGKKGDGKKDGGDKDGDGFYVIDKDGNKKFIRTDPEGGIVLDDLMSRKRRIVKSLFDLLGEIFGQAFGVK
jgi:hypothetical protein